MKQNLTLTVRLKQLNYQAYSETKGLSHHNERGRIDYRQQKVIGLLQLVLTFVQLSTLNVCLFYGNTKVTYEMFLALVQPSTLNVCPSVALFTHYPHLP